MEAFSIIREKTALLYDEKCLHRIGLSHVGWKNVDTLVRVGMLMHRVH